MSQNPGLIQFMCSAVISFQTSKKLPFLLILKDLVDPFFFFLNYLYVYMFKMARGTIRAVIAL